MESKTIPVLSFALNVPKFSGPLTAPQISHWLWRCSQAFKKWEKFYSREMDDETKIEEAGNAILNQGVTQKLYKWWVANARHLVAKDWDEFRGMLQSEALGNEWQFEALKEYYTASQGAMSAMEFYYKLQELSEVIGHIGGDCSAIDPFTEKCNLLFRARPSVLDAVLEDRLNKFSIFEEDLETIIQRLEKYNDIDVSAERQDESKTADTNSKPAKTPPPVYKDERPKHDNNVVRGGSIPTLDLSGVLYMIGAQAYGFGFTSDPKRLFSDLGSLIAKMGSPKIRSIKVFCRSVAAGTLLSYEVEHTQGSHKSSSDWDTNPHTILYLDGDEYIVSCRYTRQVDRELRVQGLWPKQDLVRDFMLETSKGKILRIGRPSSACDRIITAPSGWAIVGFHGAIADGCQLKVISSLDCIFARVGERE